MDDDPFDSVAHDCANNLQKLTSSINKWTISIKPLIENSKKKSSSNDTKLKTSKKNEILLEYSSFQTDLKQIEWDIQELQDVVNEIKNNPAEFKLLDSDVIKRQNTVDQMNIQLGKLRKSVDAMDLKNKLETPNQETPLSRFQTSNFATENAAFSENSNNNNKEPNWNQQQEQIIKDQDTQLDLIGESIGALKNMSHSIGEELAHQSNMLDEIGTDMNQAMGKTDQVLKRLAQVTHLDSDKRQWYAIFYLALAIIFLLILNIIW